MLTLCLWACLGVGGVLTRPRQKGSDPSCFGVEGVLTRPRQKGSSPPWFGGEVVLTRPRQEGWLAALAFGLLGDAFGPLGSLPLGLPLRKFLLVGGSLSRGRGLDLSNFLGLVGTCEIFLDLWNCEIFWDL